ncbi:N-acetylneuraminate synthase [Clostridium sp.]|uniref:N-acetylneuraminate synthase n=1 Tax=Clostridium sp. TaxID=1506 RepID=UPI002618E894|nr:N-acetylneuraminate synthase [Clostridium sp.]
MKTQIIAEIGVNHNGNYEIAEKMVYEAKKCGADIVKFQTAKPELVMSKFAEKAEYQINNTNNNESQLEMCKKIHLPFEDYIKLKDICDKIDIQFLSTPFDLESVDFLKNMDIPLWKIPSGEITNLPYLIKIANTHKPIIMSTGMCEIREIEEAMKILKENGSGEITLLHCTTEYPAPIEDVNLKAMLTLKEKFNVNVGYSDHTKGIEVPIAAVAMGAMVIEKHFTLDKSMEGPDHKASLEPSELKEMINSIRNVELAMGNGEKKPAASEVKNIEIARKSIVAKVGIKKDDILTEENITVKRPGNGISPMKWFEVLGKKAIRDFEEDELIEI